LDAFQSQKAMNRRPPLVGSRVGAVGLGLSGLVPWWAGLK